MSLRTIALVFVLLAAPSSALATLRIVGSTPDLAAVAREIGGDRTSVTALALHTQDPHWVDARPNLALDLSRADLLLVTGLDLEVGWLPTLIVGSRSSAIQRGARGYLDCSTLVQLLERPTARVDRSQGDVHVGGNPHYMLDPRRAAAVARGIAARLKQLDAAGASAYDARLAQFLQRLSDVQRRIEADLRTLRGAKVIGYHRSFPYLADWLGLTIVDHLEPRPGIPPNPQHVSHVLSTARREGVRILLQESWFPSTTAELVAARAGARVVRIPGGPDFRAGETYASFLQKIAARLRGT